MTDLAERYANKIEGSTNKRYHSPYWLRRWAYRTSREAVIPHLPPGSTVLEAGCGDGILSCLMAGAGHEVTGIDISQQNVDLATGLAERMQVPATFKLGNAAWLPFPDRSFDVVVSCHVLEHLQDIDAGVREIRRVMRDRAVIAMPTCLTPACWGLQGHSDFWHIGKRAPIAIPIGFLKTMLALVRGQEGVGEWYEGQEGLTHVWRFPWVMRRLLERNGLRIVHWEAGPLVIPYLPQYVPALRPLQESLDRVKAWPVLLYLGYGSLVVCEKA